MKLVEFFFSSVAGGALFILVFRFVGGFPLSQLNKPFLIQSMIATFVISQLVRLIGLDTFFTIPLGIALGYGLAQIIRSDWINYIFRFLRIDRSFTKDFYADILHKRRQYVQIKNENGTIILGTIDSIEEYRDNCTERKFTITNYIYVDGSKEKLGHIHENEKLILNLEEWEIITGSFDSILPNKPVETSASKAAIICILAVYTVLLFLFEK